MEIFTGFARGTILTPQVIKQNNNVLLTSNLTTTLLDCTITKTNKFYFYHDGLVWRSRINKIGISGSAGTFSDIINSIIGSTAKLTFNTTTNKILTEASSFHRLTGGGSYIAGAVANLNAGTEINSSTLLTISGVGNGSGISYSSATQTYTFTNSLNKKYVINYYLNLPFTSLTVGAEMIFRIRQTNITGTILGEQHYFNSALNNSYYVNCQFSIITDNPSSLVYTVQLASGTFTSSAQSVNIISLINQI